MVSVLKNFRRTLDDRWTVHAHVSPNMTSALDSRLRTNFHLRMRLEKETLRVAPASIGNNYTEFNLMYTRPDFWRRFKAPYVLMFQLDTCLCGSPTRSLQSFIDSGFSFVGAPWGDSVCSQLRGLDSSAWCQSNPRSCHSKLRKADCVGNSGLSLWRRNDILRLTTAIESSGKDEFAKYRMTYTDLWVSAHLQSKHWSSLKLSAVPTAADAAYFAVESTGLVPGVTPVGVHLNKHQIQFKKYLTTREEQDLVLRCPALAEVFYRLDATRHAFQSRGELFPENVTDKSKHVPVPRSCLTTARTHSWCIALRLKAAKLKAQAELTGEN